MATSLTRNWSRNGVSSGLLHSLTVLIIEDQDSLINKRFNKS